MQCKPIASALLLLALALPVAAGAVDLVGLSEGRAVLQFPSGKTRVLREGDSAEGVRLVKVSADAAVVEAEGRRETLVLGGGKLGAGTGSGAQRVTLVADASGHFYGNGSINGGAVRFLVDTGASMVSMGASEARRLGINYLAGKRGAAQTANGVARIYKVTLDNLTLGEVRVSHVDATIGEMDMPFVLLGMSFLSRMEMRQEGSDLVLTKRF